ncbi:MAG: Yip1 family protein [Thermodesulfobacteriota bacterium]
MNLVDRAKNLILQPKAEWETIAAEESTTAGLYQQYIMPLAGIPAVAGFLGMSLIGVSVPLMGTVRTPFLQGLSQAVVSYGLSLAGVFLLALLIDALAPNFGGEKNQGQALKVAAYSYTPGWIAGALLILPSLGVLILLASFYSLYLLYLGLPVLMKANREKALPYTVVVVTCALLLSMIFAALANAVGGPAPGMHGMR